ncbi:site-specific DNA recombinase [Alicyclobacillus hesperidum]|uniref:Site-specific DNA recombinase n=1 Tax=Alicyclobacillus hesperidum TaxID=89784 RepID=A0A1H2UZ84_9BACL|nr:recombinase family protein [Alicyclobacillus hesperidum]SDW61371.1 site-specific DNA recombinase [Alicyclobacillus hesperidum]
MTDKRLALYVRVSTEEQAQEGNSVFEQEEQLVQFARGNGYSEFSVYRDEGYSAKNLERPAMKRLRSDIRAGKIVGVVTTRIDRLTRRVADFAKLIEEMNEHGVFYRSTRQNFEIGTAMGRLVAQILSVIAEFEREMIAERVYENLLSMARRGTLAQKPPYGYDLVAGRLTPNPQEAPWVREAARLLLSGQGARQVAKYLNDRGVPSKTGRLWSETAIRTLFQNPTLMGTAVWNRRKGTGRARVERNVEDWICIEQAHEALLTSEEFTQINRLFQRRQSLPPRTRGAARLLSGIAKCGYCGANMHAGWQIYERKDGRQRRRIYRCGTYVQTGGCVANRVDAEEFERCVTSQVLAAGTAKINFSDVLLRAQTDPRRREADLRRRQRRLQQRIDRLIDGYTRGVLGEEDFRRHVSPLRAEMSEYDAQLVALATATPDPVLAARQRLERLCKDLDGDEAALRLAVLELVQEVRVFHRDRSAVPELEIVYRL